MYIDSFHSHSHTTQLTIVEGPRQDKDCLGNGLPKVMVMKRSRKWVVLRENSEPSLSHNGKTKGGMS